MRTGKHFLLLALATAAAVVVAGNRAPRPPIYITMVVEETRDVLSQPPSSLETFAQTPDGNWRTIIKTPNGEVAWEWEPGNKFTPTVRTELTLMDAATALVRYTYHISNDANSRQQINFVNIGSYVPAGVAFTRVPAGWNVASDFRTLMVNGRDLSSGIRPGSTDSVEIEARRLPGVVEVNLRGNVEFVDSVPDGLTTKQYDEWHQISGSYNPYITARAVAPTIPSGRGLSEATVQGLFWDVAVDYAPALLKYQYPYRAELAALFEWNRIEQDVKGVLMQLKAITKKPVTDPWHQEISNALSVCADILLARMR